MIPTVSIIMPTYNVAVYIEESILSIQSQTFKEWELIVVDDASEDDTISIVERLMSSDSRIKLLYSKINQGVAVSRNKGIAVAKGSFISFLDGDDLWNKHFLEKMLYKQREKYSEVVYCGHNRLLGNEIESKGVYPNAEGNVLLYAVGNRWMFHIGAVLIEQEFLIKYGVFFIEQCPIGEDVEFLYKLFVYASVAVVSEDLMSYRKRVGSTMEAVWDWEKSVHYVTSLERVLKYINEKYDGADKTLVLKALLIQINEGKCRFLWKLIKNRLFEQVDYFLIDIGWLMDIEIMDINNIRLSRRIEISIIKSQKPLLWRTIAFLSHSHLIK